MVEGHPKRFVAAAVAGVAYTQCYFLRKLVSSSTVYLRESAGFPETVIGAITSAFALAYGLSRVPGGLITDKLGARTTLAASLFISAALTIAVTCIANANIFYILWFLHGMCQASAWPACARLLKDLFPDRERAFWWAAVSTSQNVGAALTPILVAHIYTWFQERNAQFPLPIFPHAEADATWRFPFLVLALLCLPVVILAYALVPSYTVPREPAQNKATASKHKGADKPTPSWWNGISQLPSAIFLITIANMLIYAVRDIIGNWLLLIFHETRGFDPARGASVLALFEIGGITGGLLAGIASDKVFGGRRGPIFGICSFGLLLSCTAVSFAHSYAAICAVFFSLGLFLFGPQTLVGLFAMETAPPHLDSFAAGIVGLCAQLGGITAGYPVSLLKTACGWDCVLLAMPVIALLCFAASVPLWHVKPYGAQPKSSKRSQKKKKKKKVL
ncbi:hypothetical protein PTSG_12733 [Salpingoeca rosetta]|uniref:Major facilitator superfamily (MFS) profile domain-containing protein n=1 Tax=Salpingoeca rosetta (strain ATCC 50818 / BSB-021) TaxID=946362 RepID=F2UJS5_SALR5|nr:uncharacterized protein PTSG_12733 [Salpingoeca rosetta]EGD77374.1 hypothetical protein PTSG_12733 [Salpingoeca rosetta]|eukprot:XP_004990718.1 hypothetical protein PTSG_12733 [Salpingoeca rosetta]